MPQCKMAARKKTTGEPYLFEARLERLDEGMAFTIVPLPDAVADALGAASVRRVVGTLNGHPFRRGVLNRRDGLRFLMFGLPLRRSFGVRPGDRVRISLEADPDPDLVEIPDELARALEFDDEARERWETFTPGKKRSLAYHVAGAKREVTRENRAVDLVAKIRTRTLHGDLHPRR